MAQALKTLALTTNRQMRQKLRRIPDLKPLQQPRPHVFYRARAQPQLAGNLLTGHPAPKAAHNLPLPWRQRHRWPVVNDRKTHHQPRQRLLWRQGLRPKPTPYLTTIRTPHHALVRIRRVPPERRQPDVAHLLKLRSRVIQMSERPPQQIFPRIAEHLGKTAVARTDHPLLRHHNPHRCRLIGQHVPVHHAPLKP